MLIKAVTRGDEEAVGRLLKSAELTQSHLSRVDRFVRQGAEPESYMSLSRLVERRLRKYLAGQMQVEGFAEALISLALPIGRSPEEGRTALTAAVLCNNPKILVMLCDHSNPEQLNISDATGATPLTLACEHGYLDCIKILVKNQAGLNSRDRLGRTPLSCAIKARNAEECVEFLLNCEAMYEVANLDGETPLSIAATYGKHRIIRNIDRRVVDFELLSFEPCPNLFVRIPFIRGKIDKETYKAVCEFVAHCFDELSEFPDRQKEILEDIMAGSDRAQKFEDLEAKRDMVNYHDGFWRYLLFQADFADLVSYVDSVPDRLVVDYESRVHEGLSRERRPMAVLLGLFQQIERRSQVFRDGFATLRSLFWCSILRVSSIEEIKKCGMPYDILAKKIFDETHFDLKQIIGAGGAKSFFNVYTNLRYVIDRRAFECGKFDSIVMAAKDAVSEFYSQMSDEDARLLSELLGPRRFASFLAEWTGCDDGSDDF